jgi:hypothetical protein
MSARAGPGVGPVVEFCAALRQLRQSSGYEVPALARRLNVSRTQLYAILSGDIKRPPDWAKIVGPLVEACTGGDRQALAAWRHRHSALVDLCDELSYQSRARPSAADLDVAPPAG